MKKKDVFIKFAQLEDNLSSKNINLVINSIDVSNILECLFIKGDCNHNSWMKNVIKEFLDRKC